MDASRNRRRLALALVAAGIAGVWLIVLPAASRDPQISAWVARHESLGIDPAALYYSELEVVDPALQSVRAARRRSPHAW